MSEAVSATGASNQSTVSEKISEFLFNTQRLLGQTPSGPRTAPHSLDNKPSNQISVLELIEKLPYLVQEDAIVGWLGLKRRWFKAPKPEELLEQVMLDAEESAMDALDLVDLETAGFLGSDEHYEAVRRTIVQGLKVVDLLAHMRLRILAKYPDERKGSEGFSWI